MGDEFFGENFGASLGVDLSPYVSQVTYEPDDAKCYEQWSYGTNTSDFTLSSNDLSDAAFQQLQATIESMFSRSIKAPAVEPAVVPQTRRAISLGEL